MNKLSILLIDEQISVAAAIGQVVSHTLSDFGLSIIKTLDEALAHPEPAHVILLSMAQLPRLDFNRLGHLQQRYPNIPIILLHSAADAIPHDLLAQALTDGAADYVSLSEAGLIMLGRKLAALAAGLNQSPASLFDQVLNSPASPLAVQVIDTHNRVQVWNAPMEQYTGLPAAAVLGQTIEALPFNVRNLGRLKDILEQARLTGQPFTVPAYPLEDQRGQVRWGRVYVVPLPPAGPNAAVGIIRADISDLRTQFQETHILREISREISKNLDLNSALQKIAEQTKYLLNADRCHIYLLEKDNKTLRPAYVIGPTLPAGAPVIMLGQGVPGVAAAAGKAIMWNFGDPQFAGSAELPPVFNHRHLMCAPLTALNGVVGLVLVCRHAAQTKFEESEFRFFQDMVQQASSAISNARLFEETQRNLQEMAIFYEASAAIATTWNTQEVLNTLIRQMVQGMQVSSGQIISWDKNTRQGSVQALFLNEDVRPYINGAALHRTLTLADRPAIASIINQQRPVFFQRSNDWLDETERQDMAHFGCLSRLLVPLVIKSETIGWAELWETRLERMFTPDEVRLVRILANQAAVTLENARYLKQTQETLEETTALYEVARALATVQDTQAIMSIVLKEYLELLDLKQGTIIVFDFENKVGAIRVSLDEGDLPQRREGRQIPLGHDPIYAELMRTRRPVVIDNTTTTGSQAWQGPNTRSMLVIPIQLLGEITGALAAEATHQRRVFNDWSISLGQAMADQLSVALQNAQLYEMEYERRQQAETLREVSFVVGSSLNLEDVLEHILDQLGRVIKYDSAAIHLIEGKQRRIIAARGFTHPEKVIGMAFPIQLDPKEPGSIAIHTRQPLVIGNIQELYHAFTETPHRHIKSWMGIPLIARDNVIGLISIDRTQINAYDESAVNLALAFANQVAVALENARLYELEVRQLERELDIAQGIQETLLPQEMPHLPGLDIYGRVLPARQVGGDFFQFALPIPDHFSLAIGDVSGKGIPAALYMAVTMTAIDAQINDNPQPGQLLNKLQRVLFNRLQENKMNLGLQVAGFNLSPKSPSERYMTLASAGMISPIVAGPTGCTLLPVSGFPLGTSLADIDYNETKIPLDPHTAVIFTSDGIVEARNEQGELFGFERLETAINQINPTLHAQTIVDHLINAAQQFTGQAEQNDDMTVVVVVVKP